MNKLLVAVVVISLCFSCNSKQEEKTLEPNYSTIERKALRYFVDSLLYRNQIFAFEKETYDSSNLILPPSIYYDSSMYLKEGLFAGFDIYADSIITGLSTSFMDSVELEYASDDIKQEQNILQKNYDSLVYDLQSLIVDLPELIKPIDQKEFEVLRPSQSMFLEIKQALPYTGGNKVIEFKITRYYSTTHDSYDLYIIMDENRVIDWFFD
ncbi:hypothetical protein FNH22_31535 [Fulvivirga sp. M361]|uniref:hypothetical protein n=1 Tax=Fulvivirga sp. M361 TaxID=2594266 RepID=UPI00117AAB0A|nr:hypothetical protein [Fulvivirga sp. M361]TRX45316.1 hypothetical protein FNH22_31535 [Fulvivirga sp. M361]